MVSWETTVKLDELVQRWRSSMVAASAHPEDLAESGDADISAKQASSLLLACQKVIGYKFENPELLLQALKHRSYLSVSQEARLQSNERLEFLGDAVLELATTDYLYRHFREASEGELSKMKSILVSRKALAQVAGIFHLGEFVLMNRGEAKSGGRKRTSNLANTFEAILGAMFLDAGFDRARAFVEKHLLRRSNELLQARTMQNYKSQLLEYVQAQGWDLPEYSVVEESGPDHEKEFQVAVQVRDEVFGPVKGSSKKRAEQGVAMQALRVLQANSRGH
jgi:ribonuclease-3